MFRNKRNNNATKQVSSSELAKKQRYEELVHSFHTDVFRYAYWLSGDRQVAEDITQETFLRAWRSLETLKDEGAAKSWLITILRRENARRFERKQFDYVDVEQDNLQDNGSLDNEQHAEQYLLRKHMAKLEAEYREPLLLQVIAGFSGDEIANILSLNRNTVMTRLFRARNQLKEALEAKDVRTQSDG